MCASVISNQGHSPPPSATQPIVGVYFTALYWAIKDLLMSYIILLIKLTRVSFKDINKDLILSSELINQSQLQYSSFLHTLIVVIHWKSRFKYSSSTSLHFKE